MTHRGPFQPLPFHDSVFCPDYTAPNELNASHEVLVSPQPG